VRREENDVSKHKRKRLEEEPTGEACTVGCRSRSSGAPIRCHGSSRLCDDCYERLLTWLRETRTYYALLGLLVQRGSVEEAEGRVSKRPDPPMPIRPEVVALLDHRGNMSVLGRLNSWARFIKEARRLSVSGEDWQRPCSPFLIRHLPHIASSDDARVFYQMMRLLNSQLRNAAGERTAKPVGTCAAERQQPDGSVVACGGPLLVDKYRVGVYCPRCGDKWGEEDLRGLGVVLGGR
jgi:hypothetical protein